MATDSPAYPAVLRGRQAGQRQGLRERRRVRDRQAARLRADRRQVGRASRSTPPTRPARRSSTSTSTRSRSRPRGPRRSTSAPRTSRRRRRSSCPRARSTPTSTSLADFKDAKFGVQIGTTSLDAVNDDDQARRTAPKVFDNSNDVVTALKENLVDAVVVDLPTAFYITAAQVDGSTIAGQFEAPGGDEWGALLAKGSQLTDVRRSRDRPAQGRRHARQPADQVDGRRQRAELLQ